jgi:glycosyltransferase involved in cell wall biosynthesis
MLMGLALVTTNFQDEERFIENERTGFYSNDPDQLLDYLRFLLDHPDQALKVGSRGRETAAKRFGLDRFLDEWQRLLQKVTA